jgi:hypothetical protein
MGVRYRETVCEWRNVGQIIYGRQALKTPHYHHHQQQQQFSGVLFSQS